MHSPPPRSLALGVFIIGQLVFLFTANAVDFAKDYRTRMASPVQHAVEAAAPGWTEEKGHMWELTEQIAKTDLMWSQLTGQHQSWSLFAPKIARACVFPAVEYRWDVVPESLQSLARPLTVLAGTTSLDLVCLNRAALTEGANLPKAKIILSENEPSDLNRYFRFGNFRLRRYENNLVLTLQPGSEEEPDEIKKRWSEAIRRHVADNADILHGYLRWRLAAAEAGWTGQPPPNQVILIMRRYHIKDEGEAPPYWDGPHELPLARWQPQAFWDNEHQPIERYDPVSEHFKSLRK